MYGYSYGYAGAQLGAALSVPAYPLDLLTGAQPMYAYGAIKLRSAYSGSAFRVVRPSDSATLDVGFVGQLPDYAALDAFLGSETGQVDIWYDQSGNGNNAAQSTAASRPVVENGATAGGPVLIARARPVIFSGHGMALPSGVSTTRRQVETIDVAEHLHSNPAGSSLVQLGADTDQITFFAAPIANSRGYLRGNPGTANSGFSPLSRVAYFSMISSASGVSVGQNEEVVAGSAQTDVALNGGALGTTTLSAAYNGKYYSMLKLGFGRILDTGERNALRAAIETMFAIPVAVTRTICFEGDSITAGSDSPYLYGYAKMVERLISQPARVLNLGSGGAQLQNDLTLYSGQVGPILSRYASDNRVVLLFMGTNDLTVGGRSAAQIYADIQTYAGYVRASGGKIIVATLLPNKAWNGTQQTTRNDLNTLIRTNWASFADGLADFAADPTMGPQAAASDNALYPDGLHPSRVGHSYLAPIAAAAIQALL